MTERIVEDSWDIRSEEADSATAEACGHADWFGSEPDSPSARFGGRLTIDLAAIVANYRTLAARASSAGTAAVVKADAYGLGVHRVAPTLAAAGCDTFFVAHVDEGLALRSYVPPRARILVLNGAAPGAERDCLTHRLQPVLNCREQFEAWTRAVTSRGVRSSITLQFDTGMSRFGFACEDTAWLRDALDRAPQLSVGLVMSHLACADAPSDPANAMQRDRLAQLRAYFPDAAFSLAASSGIFLGRDFHLDMIRPGAALYGVSPTANRSQAMAPVVRLQGRVMQVRRVPQDTGIGYGLTAKTTGPTRLATVAVGYADGYLRSLSNAGSAWLGDLRLPVVGRVSMDSIVVDIGRAPEGAVRHGGFLDLICPRHGVDDVAREAGTIGYEILTSLGHRYERRYEPLQPTN